MGSSTIKIVIRKNRITNENMQKTDETSALVSMKKNWRFFFSFVERYCH